MQIPYVDFPFTLMTSCFSGTALGKSDDHAEMRIPPIRGHVRFWHRVLLGPADCNRVWGSTNGTEGHGSRVSLSFAYPVSTKHASPDPTILPHKQAPNQRGRRPALAAGELFTLRLHRLVGCSNDDWDKAQRAVKLWLLLGCLGLRANRAAGSVWPEGTWVPTTLMGFTATLQALGLRTWSVAIIGLDEAMSPEKLREVSSDTLAGNPHRTVFGGINPRTPSPIRFKVIRLDGAFYLLGSAPAIQVVVQGAHQPILRHAENLLLPKARWRALGPWRHLLP